ENLLKKYQIAKPYLIYVGNAYPHKNLETLFAAIKIINKKTKLNLVVVTARNVFSKRLEVQIAKNNLEKNVQITPYIQSDELNSILRNSEAYVFPSLSEGFGIPGLNAMAAGVPVLASNIPTLQEIYQDAAIYFEPKNPTDIADKIINLLKSSKTKDDLIKKGFTQVKKYSWQKMAEETLKVYQSVN
ncbi:MAG: glycosyltransferase family 1 protein, partial [Candidatus Magasanikbacteria bacterium]|nr:glycosyltransferase family 1 protein [Candidatus Magasanikbacteria bacterium]